MDFCKQLTYDYSLVAGQVLDAINAVVQTYWSPGFFPLVIPGRLLVLACFIGICCVKALPASAEEHKSTAEAASAIVILVPHPAGRETYRLIEAGLARMRAQGVIRRAYEQAGVINARVADWRVINQLPDPHRAQAHLGP